MTSFLRSPTAAYVLLPTAAACWAGNHVIARAVAGQVPPASLCALRWLLLTGVIWLFARQTLREDWDKLRSGAVPLVFLGLTGAAGFGTLQFVALQYTTALNMGVVGSVAPAFIVIASFVLFGDRMGALQLLGVTISLAGVLAIVSRLHPELLGSLSFNLGDLIVLANMLLWGVYSACLRMRPAISNMSFIFAISVVALIANLPFAAWEYSQAFVLQPTGPTLIALLYSAFVTTLLAYFCWNRGIELVGAPRASAFLHTVPLFSALFATTLLGERIEAYHVVGFAMILAGVTLAARPVPARGAQGGLGK